MGDFEAILDLLVGYYPSDFGHNGDLVHVAVLAARDCPRGE